MKKSWLNWVFEAGIPLLIIAGFVFLLVAPRGWWSDTNSVLIGKAAPDISYTTALGEKTKLSEKRGKVLLLNFWASWCGPCIQEMPSLRNLEQALPREKFEILAFNVDPLETASTRQKTQPYPDQLIFEMDREALGPYSQGAIPVSVVINQKGIVRDVTVGPRNWSDAATIDQFKKLIDDSNH